MPPRNRENQGNHLGSYEDFLQAFKAQGYQFLFFQELDNPEGQIVLRHDVDFDTQFALEMAWIEHSMGIKSTYFFMLRSNFYNVMAPKDFNNILNIRELGHQISVHFDPTIYENFQEGLTQEISMFENCFKEKVQVISFHRPSVDYQNYDAPIAGIEHTYQSKYFRNIKYFSDSTGIWRFGHPTDSEEFQNRQSLHVLIHPIWWMINGNSNLKKLEAYFAQRIDSLKQEFSTNCIPFRKIEERVG
ncbi:MAG: hypothetical protein IPJ40_22175 [Saprospirales bacterium]|nr:hypothetical protein [Saprospirales bacterium]